MTSPSARTDRAFWAEYWRGRAVAPAGRHFFYRRLLDRAFAKGTHHSFVELGGFPGVFATYVARRYGCRAAIVDSFVDSESFDAFVRRSGLVRGSIEAIEGDIFQLTPPERFDMVLSGGLIEHFDDIRPILERHLAYLAAPGTLVVTVPNFRGLNGWLQKRFDPEMLARHNLSVMSPEALRAALSELGLVDVDAFYYGGFRAWLEAFSQRPLNVRLFVYVVRVVGVILQALPGTTRLTARDVAAIARRATAVNAPVSPTD